MLFRESYIHLFREIYFNNISINRFLRVRKLDNIDNLITRSREPLQSVEQLQQLKQLEL